MPIKNVSKYGLSNLNRSAGRKTHEICQSKQECSTTHDINDEMYKISVVLFFNQLQKIKRLSTRLYFFFCLLPHDFLLGGPILKA